MGEIFKKSSDKPPPALIKTITTEFLKPCEKETSYKLPTDKILEIFKKLPKKSPPPEVIEFMKVLAEVSHYDEHNPCDKCDISSGSDNTVSQQNTTNSNNSNINIANDNNTTNSNTTEGETAPKDTKIETSSNSTETDSTNTTAIAKAKGKGKHGSSEKVTTVEIVANNVTLTNDTDTVVATTAAPKKPSKGGKKG